MKIAVFEAEPWERRYFESLEGEHDIVIRQDPLNEETARDVADSDVISTFIYSDLGTDTLRQFDQAKLIATRSTGVNHVDLDFCRQNGIKVCNVPTYGSNTVAELAFALMHATSRHLIQAADRTRRGDFSQAALEGRDMHGRTLGVIGTGDIGRWVIRIAGGYGMEVLAFDVKPDEDCARQLGFRYVDMDELLSRSDIVTVHVPAIKATHHLLGKEQFDRMKDGTILINTARGSIVDTSAMIHALSSGRLAAAGLDVLEEEPSIRDEAELLRTYFAREHGLETLLGDHILLRMRNVVVTPHIGFNTREAVCRILDTTRDNIAAFMKGEPQNVVVG